MSTTCILQTKVDEETKKRAQKIFAKRGMTMSEGLRVALDHEIKNSYSASVSERLQNIFTDADQKREASGKIPPTVESIVEFCNSVKQQRANKIAES